MTNNKYSIVIYQVNKEIKATFYYKGNLQTAFVSSLIALDTMIALNTAATVSSVQQPQN